MLIYYLPLTNSSWDTADTILIKYVSQERKKRIQKYINIIDKKLSLYAELVVRMGLSLLTKLPITEFHFLYNANRKPQLLNCSGIDFNIAHTNKAILCILSSSGSVGADIEAAKNPPFDIMDAVFHSEEINYVNEAPLNEKEVRFYQIWTKKEAITKRSGIGLTCDLKRINTLSLSYYDALYSWREGEYVCCICANNAQAAKPTCLSEYEIFQFYGI